MRRLEVILADLPARWFKPVLKSPFHQFETPLGSSSRQSDSEPWHYLCFSLCPFQRQMLNQHASRTIIEAYYATTQTTMLVPECGLGDINRDGKAHLQLGHTTPESSSYFVGEEAG